MFKFMKSKKGFTLVELMIVVVIMAILVAVAVPIFSAVTKNARTKTCIANQREIVSQLSNYSMSNNTTYGCKITIDADTAKPGEKAGEVKSEAVNGGTVLAATTFTNLFQEVPYCPAGGAYTVEIGAANLDSEAGGSVEIKIGCAGVDESTDHVYGTATAATNS